MLFAAMAFAAGICWAHLASGRSWTPPSWQITGAVLLLVIAAGTLRHHRISCAASLIAVALLGTSQSNLGRSSEVLTLPPELDNQEVEINGWIARSSLPIERVVHDPNWPEEDDRESYQQIDVKVTRLECEEPVGTACKFKPNGFGVRIGIYGAANSAVKYSSSPEISYGQVVRIRGRIRPPFTYQDPGVFDYPSYLLDNGIAAVLSAKQEEVQVLPGQGGTRWGRWRAQARSSLLKHVLALHASDAHRLSFFSISRNDTALIAAMLLGERALLDEGVKTDFQRTGSYHLLVVSGLAIAILAFAVFWLARLLLVSESGSTVISAGFLGIYVSLTDLGAPVQRAALMCALYMLGRLLYRERNPLNAIGAAALVALVMSPKALFDAGFQMTFLAVLAIAGVAVPVIERSTGILREALRQLDSTSFDLHLLPRQAQFRLDLRMILSRLELLVSRWVARRGLLVTIRLGLRVAEVVFISALMQAALAVPMAVYFHRATIAALPVNVAVVPIMSVLLPTAMLTTLLSYGGAWLAAIPTYVTALLLHSVSASVVAMARFRAADLRVPDPPVWASILCLVALGTCFFAAKRGPKVLLPALAVLAMADWGLLRVRQPDIVPSKLEITAIDVGQGDSLLVVLPEGETLLVDGGGTLAARTAGFDIGEEVVSPYLWYRGISRLDVVALTHPHGDHIGGLPAVLRNFHPKELWLSPSPPNAALDALIQQAKDGGIPIHYRVAGDRIDFGGAKFAILAPRSGSELQTGRDNDDSMVMRVAYGATSILLEGDAEKKTEYAIAPELSPVTLLKVGHHGSATSTTQQFINRVQPQFAVISVGRFNRYGHPSSEVTGRLSQEGACTFRTDINGAVSLYLDGKRLRETRWGRMQEVMDFPNWIPPRQEGHCAGLQ